MNPLQITRSSSAGQSTGHMGNAFHCRSAVNSHYTTGRPDRAGSSSLSGAAGIEDLEPTPNTPEHRRWRWPTFSLIWGSSTANPAASSVGAALLALGLSWWEATVAHFIGGVIVVLALVFTAWPGTKYGIPFPVLARSSFGQNGAQFCTLTRGMVAILWLSFQLWQGALGLYTAIGVIAGESFLEWGRLNPYLTTSQLLVLLAFTLLHAAVIGAGIGKHFQRLVYVTAPLQVLLFGGVLWWACTLAPIDEILATETQTSSDSVYGWLVAINASVATWSTMVLNVADLSRFCPSQRDQIVGQSLGIPLPFAITGWIGMVAAGATYLAFGERLWQIPQYFQHWPPGWALAGGIVNALSTLVVNVMANLLSPMNDLLNLAPGRLNFRACGYFCLAVAVALCPWVLFASDRSFVETFLNGYGMVTGALGGILITDFWIVRRTMLIIRDLYPKGNEKAIYSAGVNWRALVATAVGVGPCIPGFLDTLGVPVDSEALRMLYAFSWFFALSVSGSVYWALMSAWPPAAGLTRFTSLKEVEVSCAAADIEVDNRSTIA